MQKKVLAFIEEHHMIQKGDRIVAGVSGGADSVALFYLLLELQECLSYEFCVVHVEHGIRGEESKRDARFVEQLCREHQILYGLYSYDVKALARQQHLSVEEAGRKVRMEAFERQMRKWGGNKVALAHHRDDLAETVLHHLCRGSGISGLVGIRPVYGEKIRPLLCLERREIEHYLKERGYAFVTDSTNADDIYTRNKIRHRVLPFLVENVNAQTVGHIADAAMRLGAVDDYMKLEADRLLHLYEKDSEEKSMLDIQISERHPAILQYALLQWLEKNCGRKDITAVHLAQLCGLFQKQTGKFVELPGGYRVYRQYEAIVLQAPGHILQKVSKRHWKLELQKEIPVGNGTVFIRIFPYSGEEIPQKTYTKWLNYDKMEILPEIRYRQPGDYLVINERGDRKKLKQYFIDSKVPRDCRDAVLLLTIGSEVLWIIGGRINAAYKVKESTQRILEIRYQGGKADGRQNQCIDQ